MRNLIFLLLVIFLMAAVSATARKKEPVPVYIDKPPINRPRTMSIPDRNRLYAILNPRHHVPSKEMKEYLEKLKADKKWKEENMSQNKEPTPASNSPLRSWPAEGNTDEQTWDEILDN